MTTPHFIHLLCHTEFSMINGLMPVKRLVQAMQDMNMPACAVTDQSNLFALVKFYRTAQSSGIKPIIGADLRIRHSTDSISRLILLCQNSIGYQNLTKLVSRSYLEGQVKGVPFVHRKWLKNNTDGLIALSGGCEGDLGQSLLSGQISKAKRSLSSWQKLFPDRFYLELRRTGRNNEEEYIALAVELAEESGTPVVATNDVCFQYESDFEAHEVRVCIHEGYTLADEKRPRRYSPQQYLRSAEEMVELFDDIPEAIENTWRIAQRCNLEVRLGKSFLPDFPIPKDKTINSYFREQSHLGLEDRLATLFDQTAVDFKEKRTAYNQRLDTELQVIEQMGFAGYFLIVADFVQWSKENDIPVGAGRGSGAGSLVAYSLGITDLDPIHYELLFERFLNPERVSMPDFDIDFCIEGRDRVIDYVTQKYGKEKVSQIITYGTMAAKAVVRDVGRVLGYPYGFVDKIAKLIPFEIGITLEKALDKEKELLKRYQEEEEVEFLINTAKKLEGIARNAGTHAGGVVIAPSVLTDFVPLYWDGDESSHVVTQFDKGDVEDAGLVKFDFLGLRTLTIIKWALRNINQFAEQAVDISKISLNDPKTFSIFKRGMTTAVFQLESAGIKKLVKRLQPDRFEDIVALMALYRPGPLQSGMVDDFVDRKHGRAQIQYPHPKLAAILKPTYGVILYQEQVMQISQILAGYTLGGADILRRAMGKKIAKEMAKQRTIFTEGAVERGVEKETATYIFDLMEKFAQYGFNRSHSAAYALISYQTAWLKAHYPAAFMAAVLSSDMDNTDKVLHLADECKTMGIALSPPNINHCFYRFTVKSAQSRTIYYGLGALKGVGEGVIQTIVSKRDKSFTDLFDFCQRVGSDKLNRRLMEALTKSGALDELGPNRATIMASLSVAMKLAEQDSRSRAAGQNDIFGMLAPQKTEQSEKKPFVLKSEWSNTEKLNAEKESLGCYLSGHPINQYAEELSALTYNRLANQMPVKNTRIAGWVTVVRVSSKGGRVFFTLEDNSGKLDCIAYSELYNHAREILVKDNLLIVEGEIRQDKYTEALMMTASKLLTLERARDFYAKHLLIEISPPTKGLVQKLAIILKPYVSGSCRILIRYFHPEAEVDLMLSRAWQVKPKEELIQTLKDLLGEKAVKLIY